MNSNRRTRRQLLQTGCVAVALTAAGCLGSEEPEPETEESEDEPDPDLRVNGQFLSSAFPVELVEPEFTETTGFAGDARLAYVHWHSSETSHWHQSPLEIAANGERSGRTRFLTEGAEEIPLGPEETFQQSVSPTAETAEDSLMTTVNGDHVEIEAGSSEGGELVFGLLADDELRWQSPPLPVEII